MTPNGQTPTGSAGAFAAGGATVDVAQTDRGFAERPMLAPRLEFRIAEAFDGLYGREGGHGGAGCGRRPGSSTTAYPTLCAGATVRRYERDPEAGPRVDSEAVHTGRPEAPVPV